MWSNDVLHAFWIPELRVKQDILPVAEGDKVFAPNEEPAHPTVVRFTPTMTNAEILARDAREPRLVCAELCGNGHYNMFVPVRLVPEAEFIAWMDSQLAQQKPQVASAGK